MSLDIGGLINKMISSSVDVLKEELDEVPDFAKKVFEDEENVLKALAGRQELQVKFLKWNLRMN